MSFRGSRGVLFPSLALAALMGCGNTQRGIELRPGDVPGERAFVPSLAQELDANAQGEFATPGEARLRLDEFDVSSDDELREWPIDSITYRRFQNTAERAIYIRRALGRYAITEAREMGLGTSLEDVRRVAQIAAPSHAGEWWTRGVHGYDLLAGQPGRTFSLPDTIDLVIDSSYQIRAFGDLPAIRGTAIQEARGRFVPEFFAEVSVEEIDDVATSPAVAGGSDRVLTDETDAEFGVRSRLITGGEISLSQRLTVTDTNRTTYIPGEQTRSETALTYVQPLLRDSGYTYNDAARRIANMDTQIAIEEFHRQAEAHLLEVERAYWNLYVARAVFLQTSHLARHGAQISSQISARAGIDADPIVVNRAQATAQRWQADLVRAEAAVENAEFRLAALVNDPRYGPSNVELVPSSAPNGALPILTTADTIEDVLIHRPELQQAILQYEAALLREGMAANQSLPELDLVLEARMTGGADGNNMSDAFQDQSGNVTSLAGVVFSVPLGFDERDARYHRRRLETVQQERQVLAAIATVLLEVDVSANEYIVACNDLVARRNALFAAQADVRAVQARWDEGLGDAGIDLLSALLSSYENLQNAEEDVTMARAAREVSAANLARARGVLLARWGLSIELDRDVRDEQTYRLVHASE